ncbi:MAG: MarR family transcriptional regulator [Candidatus Faecousia sp.]|nr:MarR family transcriptional regulator [Candidatus Faecousia sp.]
MFHYGHMFRLLHCACSQSITAALAQMELTSAQGRVMGYLARRGEPLCAKDIEEEFHLSHPTVSGLLSRLEKKSFIEFRPDEKDGRCKRIYVSPKGLDCHERIFHVILENEKRVVQGFTQEEKEQFATLLTRAVENMGSQSNFQFEEEETNE